MVKKRQTKRLTLNSSVKSYAHNTFVDLFAGCGGLSLGLMKAGWHGLFAIEKNIDAFKTLTHNLIANKGKIQENPSFEWPKWLERKPYELRDFIDAHRDQLKILRGSVRLVVGGPPCQGFSFAGKTVERRPSKRSF